MILESPTRRSSELFQPEGDVAAVLLDELDCIRDGREPDRVTLPTIGFDRGFRIPDEFADDVFGVALCVRRNPRPILDGIYCPIMTSRHVVACEIAHDFHLEFRLVVGHVRALASTIP